MKTKQGTSQIIFFNMRKKGNRVTRARQLIINLLLKKNHLTIKDIEKLLKDQNIALATLYNNLNYLVNEGYVSETNNKGSKIYCVNSPRHYHEKCIKCGKVYYILEDLNNLIKTKHIKNDFLIEIIGICDQCK